MQVETSSSSVSTSAAYRRSLRPDMSLRIEEILLETRRSGISRRSGMLKNVLARCETSPSEKGASYLFNEKKSIFVLFSFSQDAHADANVFLSPSQVSSSMVEGTEVLIWKPIQEVAVPLGEGVEKALLCTRFLVVSDSDS